MALLVRGIGTSTPHYSISQSDAAEAWNSLVGVEGKRARTVQALYRRSGVKKRHSALFEAMGDASIPTQTFFKPAQSETDLGPTTAARMERFEKEAPSLAGAAARGALRDSALDADEITHLVTVSCTGFFAPGLDSRLIDLLGLNQTVERTHVGFMGCHGALNGLRVALSFVDANPEARVLVSSVELCTLHMSYEWDPETLVANSLFGDGAAALIGTGEVERLASNPWRLTASGTCRLPASDEAMSWRIGDHGFQMTLSPSVPDIIQTHLLDWLTHWLERSGLTPDDVKTWAVHPGGPRILTSVGDALDLDQEESSVAKQVLSDYGNMSSATILFILERLREQKAPRPCVALAFGPGLVAEAALFL